MMEQADIVISISVSFIVSSVKLSWPLCMKYVLEQQNKINVLLNAHLNSSSKF